MAYSEDKTYTIPSKFIALNGCVQEYTVTISAGIDFTKQAEILKVLEALRVRGGQPVITSIDASAKKITFTLEQASVFGADATAAADEIKAELVKFLALTASNITVTVGDAISYVAPTAE